VRNPGAPPESYELVPPTVVHRDSS
jgi:hypothetical protein